MNDKQDNKPSKALYLLTLLPVFMFGIMGAGFEFFGDDPKPASGFLAGLGVGLLITLVVLVWTFGVEWAKKGIAKGQMWPYLVAAVLAAVAISGYLAINVGAPSCDEYSDDPIYSNCTDYADDGFEATSEQKWDKFWGTLPVTVIITSLIGVIVKNGVDKNQG